MANAMHYVVYVLVASGPSSNDDYLGHFKKLW